MQPRSEDVQTIDIASLRAYAPDADLSEAALDDHATRPMPVAGPVPPRPLSQGLSPADSCYNDALDPSPDESAYSGSLPHRVTQWTRREGNIQGYAIIISLISVAILVTLGAVAIAAKVPPPAATQSWLATENNGTVDFLTGIPSADGTFTGQWLSVAPGQQQPTVAAISGTVQGGVVTIKYRDNVLVNIRGRMTGAGRYARIVFSFATFGASDWNGYKNALLNRGGH